MQKSNNENGKEPEKEEKPGTPPPEEDFFLDDQPCTNCSETAKIWRRALAFLIDSVILGIAGFLIANAFFNIFVSLGPYARFLGYAIAVFYYGYFNSEKRKGQTPGKFIMKIRVVNGRGEPISFETSLIRAAFLMLPLTLKQIGPAIPAEYDAPNQFLAMLNFLITCLGTGIIYFFLFNRGTRQSLHDLICGTFVIKAATEGPPDNKGVWKGHYCIYGCLVFIQVVVFIGIVLYILNILPHGFLGLYKDLWDIRDVNQVSFKYTKMLSPEKACYNVMFIDLYIDNPHADLKKEAEEGMGIILSKRGIFKLTDVISVKAVNQADIGIFSTERSHIVISQINKNKPPINEKTAPSPIKTLP